MFRRPNPRAHPATVAGLLLVFFLAHCSSASTTEPTGDAAVYSYSSCMHAVVALDASAPEIATCFPDHDGLNGGEYTFDLTVDDTGFSKMILATQNDATVTLTLRNTGKKPHGFEVECTSVLPAYPTVPAGCPSLACFPRDATIAPLAAGATKTITFATPTPDGLLYRVRSSEPNDCTVPGLNGSETQWSLM
jgi:hypothetical protein